MPIITALLLKAKTNGEACEDLQKAESLGMAVTEKVKKEICK